MGVGFLHLVDGIIQKLTIGWYHANIALFQFSLSSCKGPKGKLFSLWPAQNGWTHPPKNKMKVENEILEAYPLHVLHEVCGGQVA